MSQQVKMSIHAIQQARARWLELSDGDAVQAIRAVVQRGELRERKRCREYQWGSRCVRVVEGTAVTVFVAGLKKNRILRRLTRKDFRERAHQGRSKRG